MPGMRRREFVTLLGGAAAAWPIEARAQQLSSILIGFLSASSAAAFTKEIDAFRDGLRKLGYIEGRNVRLEYRFASGDLDELAVLGAELVQLKPNIIVSFALPATLALAKATSTIPIVMASGADPVGFGLVKSLSHPGGNITGLTNFAEKLASKQIDIMRELAPMGIDAAQAAKETTSSIPIVFVFGVDPIKFGFVRSLSRPNGNITGMSLYTSELHAKRVEVLNELIPAAAPMGMIINPKMPDTEPQVKAAEAVAGARGHPLIVVRASNEMELDKAFASMSENHVAGVLAVSDNFLNSRRDQTISLASRYSIPMMYPFRADATAGGLLSYGTNIDDVYRQAAWALRRLKKISGASRRGSAHFS